MNTIIGEIDFSYNWNNKLDCKAFTTIRIKNPAKYILNGTYAIRLKDQPTGEAQIKSIKECYLHDLNEWIARIDTGYSLEETIKIIRKMYPKIDFSKQKLYLILLQRP